MHEPRTRLAKFIRDHRRDVLGLTQEEFAARVGTAPGCISRWEIGDVVPSRRSVVSLARALGMRPRSLIEMWGEAKMRERADGDEE